MVNVDGLDESKMPMNLRCGPPSEVLPCLTGKTTPSLADIRNGLAHGEPLDGFPWSGLLELIRDLINYVYCDWALHRNYPTILITLILRRILELCA